MRAGLLLSKITLRPMIAFLAPTTTFLKGIGVPPAAVAQRRIMTETTPVMTFITKEVLTMTVILNQNATKTSGSERVLSVVADGQTQER